MNRAQISRKRVDRKEAGEKRRYRRETVCRRMQLLCGRRESDTWTFEVTKKLGGGLEEKKGGKVRNRNSIQGITKAGRKGGKEDGRGEEVGVRVLAALLACSGVAG